MTADIRTAAQREAETLYPNLPPEVDLPAHNRSRSLKRKAYVKGYLAGAARVTPTREQLVDVLRKHQHDYCEECHMSHGCTCGWRHKDGSLSTDDYDGEDPVGSISGHQAEVLLALLAGLAEGERQ